MAKGLTPIIGLAVVVALAMVAVFGAMSLTNPAFAAVGAPADSELAERTFSPQVAAFDVMAVGTASETIQLSWATPVDDDDEPITVGTWFISQRQSRGAGVWTSWTDWIAADQAPVQDSDPPAFTADVDGLANGVAHQFQVQGRDANATQVALSTIVDGTPNAPPAGTLVLTAKSVPGGVELTYGFVTGATNTGATITSWEYQMRASCVDGDDQNEACDASVDGDTPVEAWGTMWMTIPDGADETSYIVPVSDDVKVGELYQFRVRPLAGSTPHQSPAATADNSNENMPATGVGPMIPEREAMGPTFGSSTTTPGSVGRYEFNFDIPDETNTLIHDLIIELEDYNIPGEVGTASVTITIDDGDGNPRNDYTFTPEDVSVDGEELFISIGDVTEDTGTGGSKGGDDQVGGVYNVGGPNERMKVVFRKSAGIKNPSAADSYFANIAFGENKYDYDDLKKPDDLDVEVLRKVSLSSDKGGLGKKVTATGKGFEDGTSLTFFVDKYVGEGVDSSGDRKMGQDGILNSGEDVVCRDPEVDGDNIGTCEFTVYSPTFVGGKNYVNAIDGLGDYSELAADDEDHEFKVQASMQATPSGGSPGEIMLIQLVNFGYQADVNQVLLSGQPICDDADADARDCGYNTDNLGTADFKVEIPNWAIGGKQDLKVVAESSVDGEIDANTTVDISGPVIRVTPKEVVANQRISLIGTGFVAGARVCCGEAGSGDETDPLISIGGDVIDDSRINGGQHVRVDNGGNWSASVDLPLNESTTGDGERVIRITDSQGRTGAVVVSIPAREVTITPDTGRVGTLAVVRGKYFPSKNDEGNNFNIEIVYDAVDGRTTVSASPDAGGSFEQQIRIPTTADIPSTNTVKVSYEDGAGVVVVTAVTHSVPEGVITLSDTSGGPGSSVTINGEGFKSFVPIASVSIGSLDVTPAPKPSTDGNGMMSFPITIPGLDVGIQTIEVDVGRTVASVGFTVTESGINPGNIRPIGPALEDLGDNFVNVWHFNNDTKLWSFYDGMEGSDLTHLITGETYLMQIKSTMEVILNGDTRNLTCVGANCWNQIVW